MTSDKQVQANRRNALKSTGPKTPEGKASARYNAMKHGLLSEEVLLPGEDEAALKELSELLRDELQPVGQMENLLVDRIVAAHWRLRRLGRVEAGIFAWEHYGELASRARSEAKRYGISKSSHDVPPELMAIIAEAQAAAGATIVDKQKHEEALSRAREMEAKQTTGSAALGRVFVRDSEKANTFSKLSRYESAIERSLYKALHELQRLQAARRAEGNVPPPLAVDVDVSGVSREDLSEE